MPFIDEPQFDELDANEEETFHLGVNMIKFAAQFFINTVRIGHESPIDQIMAPFASHSRLKAGFYDQVIAKDERTPKKKKFLITANGNQLTLILKEFHMAMNACMDYMKKDANTIKNLKQLQLIVALSWLLFKSILEPLMMLRIQKFDGDVEVIAANVARCIEKLESVLRLFIELFDRATPYFIRFVFCSLHILIAHIQESDEQYGTAIGNSQVIEHSIKIIKTIFQNHCNHTGKYVQNMHKYYVFITLFAVLYGVVRLSAVIELKNKKKKIYSLFTDEDVRNYSFASMHCRQCSKVAMALDAITVTTKIPVSIRGRVVDVELFKKIAKDSAVKYAEDYLCGLNDGSLLEDMGMDATTILENSDEFQTIAVDGDQNSNSKQSKKRGLRNTSNNSNSNSNSNVNKPSRKKGRYVMKI